MAADEHPRNDDIPTIIPSEVELIDPRHRQAHPGAGPMPYRPTIRSRKRRALLLFLATCVSVFIVGMIPGAGPAGFFVFLRLLIAPVEGANIPILIFNGITYALAVIAILGAHEMGHYLQARRYGVPASLPYFIPFPISPFGTMGAVIVQGAGVANRKEMFDIAITGPLAGLVLTFPILTIGLLDAGTAELPENPIGPVFGDPLIITWMFDWLRGPRTPGHEILLNPLLFAGWVGVFITALNLMPIGQLDGGHILYTLIGRRAHTVAYLLLYGSIFYMVYTGEYAYGLILILLLIMGPRHPPTADDTVPLGLFRVILGWLTLGFIIIGFTPRPIV
ncbi:MAG: site-2 protease family protein [Planctomycetaceae bacterium]